MATAAIPRVSATVVVPKASLDTIFRNLREDGFTIVGPTVRDGAIILDQLENTQQLPIGWVEEKAAGRYRLVRGRGAEWFAHTVGPHSWKKYLYPPRLELLKAVRDNGSWRFIPGEQSPPQYAFVGVRGCELAAIAIQDKIFERQEYRDSAYVARRERIFVLAVNCGHAASTCFCTSLGTGPHAKEGFDLALTEFSDGFMLEVGSEMGAEELRGIDWEPATAFDRGRAKQVWQKAEQQIAKRVRVDDLPTVVYHNLEHEHWDDVGHRCLGCGNCTMVCPTCFCSTVQDHAHLGNNAATRTRTWDSCFTGDFSHVLGGNVRPTIRSRYRQWLTHKWAAWIDQFGSPGCTGCGRCTTWCPVGIDVTEELAAIRATEAP